MLVHHFLEGSASRTPDKTALVCGNQRLSYQELNHRADQMAAVLQKGGVRRHDRVVVFLENSPEAVIAIFGILKAGATFVVLNAGMKAGKIRFILEDCGARALVTHTLKAPIASEAAIGAPQLESILWCGSSEKKALPYIAGKESLSWEMHCEEPLAPRPVPVLEIDLATIIYTSGSTGEPKGVVSTHYNVVAAARSITTYLKNREEDIILNSLPLSFDYGLYQVLMAFLFGGTLVLESSFTFPYRIMETLVREKVTGFPIVPTMVALLLQMDLSRFDLSHLRYLTNTGAALPVPYIKRFRELFPSVAIYSMYGLTECKRALYLPPEELDRRPGSVGIPIPGAEAMVVDEEGREIAPGQFGELVIRGQNVMQGYWNRPEETARVFRPGRYRGETLLYTGDLFRRDEDGYLYFVARKDDLIKTKGERVSPKEIENVLCSLEGLAEAAVIGVPDPILGQAIKAFVVPAVGSLLDEDAVLKYCSRNLEPFMVPKFIELRSSLPKSPSGKIDKKSLSAEPVMNPPQPPGSSADSLSVSP